MSLAQAVCTARSSGALWFLLLALLLFLLLRRDRRGRGAARAVKLTRASKWCNGVAMAPEQPAPPGGEPQLLPF